MKTSGKYHTGSKAGAQTWSSSEEAETLTRDFIHDFARTVTRVNEYGDEEVAQVFCPAIVLCRVNLTAATNCAGVGEGKPFSWLVLGGVHLCKTSLSCTACVLLDMGDNCVRLACLVLDTQMTEHTWLVVRALLGASYHVIRMPLLLHDC